MHYTHVNKGTCSTQIDFDITDGIISGVSYTGGCNGNLQGVSKLVEGQNAEEVMKRLKGIKCGIKPTSCPDQLAQAIEEALRGN